MENKIISHLHVMSKDGTFFHYETTQYGLGFSIMNENFMKLYEVSKYGTESDCIAVLHGCSITKIIRK
jgi:hypothetical protein